MAAFVGASERMKEKFSFSERNICTGKQFLFAREEEEIALDSWIEFAQFKRKSFENWNQEKKKMEKIGNYEEEDETIAKSFSLV